MACYRYFLSFLNGCHTCLFLSSHINIPMCQPIMCVKTVSCVFPGHIVLCDNVVTLQTSKVFLCSCSRFLQCFASLSMCGAVKCQNIKYSMSLCASFKQKSCMYFNPYVSLYFFIWGPAMINNLKWVNGSRELKSACVVKPFNVSYRECLKHCLEKDQSNLCNLHQHNPAYSEHNHE